MTVWVVRQDAPEWGVWDKLAMGNGVAVIDFGLETDIAQFPDRQALENHLRRNAHALYGYRSGPPGRVRNAARQVWDFYKRIVPGDIAIYHVWEDVRRVRVGEFQDGDAYQSSFPEYDEGWRPERRDPIVFQVRRVNWLTKDIPMSAFDPDLHLDAPGTVYRPRYDDANGRTRYAAADAHVREVLRIHLSAESLVSRTGLGMVGLGN